MSDDDLIRRGDALKAVQDAYDDSLEPDLYDAATRIRALPATDAREAALREAAAVAEGHLMNWAYDLAETRDLYREAQSTGKMNGRNISEALARKFARDFNERAEAVAESAEHTRDAILALISANSRTT